MGKRSDFKRRKNDLYITPKEAVWPLLPWLEPVTMFNEPCAGTGALIDILQNYGHTCIEAIEAWDIDPKRYDIYVGDARTEQTIFNYPLPNCFITNPPWTREILHPIITNLSSQRPTWLLFDADWMHNKHAKPFLKHCSKIVSVGRVKWIEGTNQTSKDNCAWYLFNNPSMTVDTVFVNDR